MNGTNTPALTVTRNRAGAITEFLDDPEVDPSTTAAIRYSQLDLESLRLPPCPGAGWYEVAYGDLIACDPWGMNLAVLNTDDNTWESL
jgi:hypothetical protein